MNKEKKDLVNHIVNPDVNSSPDTLINDINLDSKLETTGGGMDIDTRIRLFVAKRPFDRTHILYDIEYQEEMCALHQEKFNIRLNKHCETCILNYWYQLQEV